MNFDIVIIGSGPAGISAAIYSVRKGLKTLLIGREVGGQVGKTGEIDNYLGFVKTTGFDLSGNFKKHLDQYPEIKRIVNREIVDIKKVKGLFKIKLDNSQEIVSRSLIIASGRNPRQLGVPGEKEFKNKGVAYCEICDAPLFKGKDVAIIGSGNSGLEAALSLAPICPKVTILEFGDKIGGDKILQDKLKKHKNVRYILNAKTLEFFGQKMLEGIKYLDLKTKKEKKLLVQGVFIQIGWVPSVTFDTLTKKNKRNEIMVDCHCQTSVAGIFAAGDCTDIGYYQIIVAAGEGAKAALSVFKYLSDANVKRKRVF